MNLQRRFPAVTRLRFIVVAFCVLSFSAAVWLFYTAVAPLSPWVVRYHIPIWLAHNWPWIVFPTAFFFFTGYAVKKGWTKFPDVPGGDWPTYPSLTNAEFHRRRRQDAEDACFRDKRSFV
jgi:hypothetical protein